MERAADILLQRREVQFLQQPEPELYHQREFELVFSGLTDETRSLCLNCLISLSKLDQFSLNLNPGKSVYQVCCFLCSCPRFRTLSTVQDWTCTICTHPVQVESIRDSGNLWPLTFKNNFFVVNGHPFVQYWWKTSWHHWWDRWWCSLYFLSLSSCRWLLLVSIERGELVIRDLGNSFINHQWTQLWNQVCMKPPDVFRLTWQ